MSSTDGCAACGVELAILETEIVGLEARRDEGWPGPDADVDQLVARVLRHHHQYVHGVLPLLYAMLRRLADAHGHENPELPAMAEVLRQLGSHLVTHLTKEEQLLFPAILALTAAQRDHRPPPASPFSTLLHPIRAMETDHVQVDTMMARVRTLAQLYAPPPHACAGWRFCLGALERFHADLDAHVHIENEVLFPRALEIERAAL